MRQSRKRKNAAVPVDGQPKTAYKSPAICEAEELLVCVEKIENQTSFRSDLWKYKWELEKMDQIRLCVETASISVLVNGVPSNRFRISRGIRQGCPLSPFLFNIVGEALSRLLKKANEMNVFEGVKVGDESLKITHLQYADDLIIFGKASMVNVLNIKRLLRLFEVIAGLKLNLTKTTIFGVNVEENIIKIWVERINCRAGTLPTEYLGLPLGQKRNRVALWTHVIEKVKSKLEGWKGISLSFAGRLTQVKAVLSNLPVYYLSLFQIPSNVADILNKCIAKFLWSSSSERPIHWVSWENICKPRRLGGLGVVDVKTKNQSLLNKWLWRYNSEPNELWRKVVVAKYGINGHNLLSYCSNSRKLSWIWRDIYKPLENNLNAFTRNLEFVLGDDQNIRFWVDWWTQYPSLKVQFPRIFSIAIKKEGSVSDFRAKSEVGWVWNVELRRSLFQWEIPIWEEFIACIERAAPGGERADRLKWRGNTNGSYTPKSFCKFSVSNDAVEDEVWKIVWSKIAPPKVQAFLWKVVKGRIPTGSELKKRGIKDITSNPEVLKSIRISKHG
ncbi:hypothetical protein GQ457_14G024300 [Hibiscus cannabinus]